MRQLNPLLVSQGFEPLRKLSIASLQLSGEHDINGFKCLLSIVLVLLEGRLFNFVRFSGAIVIVPSGDRWSNWCHCLFVMTVSSGLVPLFSLNDVGISLV